MTQLRRDIKAHDALSPQAQAPSTLGSLQPLLSTLTTDSAQQTQILEVLSASIYFFSQH